MHASAQFIVSILIQSRIPYSGTGATQSAACMVWDFSETKTPIQQQANPLVSLI